MQEFFDHIEVLPEKHEDAYRELQSRHGFEAEKTWMIGNSPRSDINPALAAGLHAVFIPHDFTWALEHEVVDLPKGNERLIELSSIKELTQYF